MVDRKTDWTTDITFQQTQEKADQFVQSLTLVHLFVRASTWGQSNHRLGRHKHTVEDCQSSLFTAQPITKQETSYKTVCSHVRDADVGGQGRCCCHFTSRNEEITLEMLAALLSSDFLSLTVLFALFGGFLSACSYEMSQHSRAQWKLRNSSWWRNTQSWEKWKEAELRVQSRAARAEHVKQSENGELESAMRFKLLAQGYNGIHLSLSVCISPEWCTLIALKSMRNTQLRAVK